jgi:hypothetical protein
MRMHNTQSRGYSAARVSEWQFYRGTHARPGRVHHLTREELAAFVEARDTTVASGSTCADQRGCEVAHAKILHSNQVCQVGFALTDAMRDAMRGKFRQAT